MDFDTHRDRFGYDRIGEDLGASAVEEVLDHLVGGLTFLLIAAIGFLACMIVSVWLGVSWI